jgi:hypothetical protein
MAIWATGGEYLFATGKAMVRTKYFDPVSRRAPSRNPEERLVDDFDVPLMPVAFFRA